ncbi:hypothetical protein LUA82_04325 [Neoehrlichia mikurensis]|uniref:Uncharacterized protein n=1 Tax=Neoehrlichia mikurensis TaxID=89586 RepID=A0A9Q9BRX0_9RICK|nr:hypothetical protein [Neoehrlichia mikurensis]UTO55375.1 hypothetical protein LUA82_04325 [Neoehrlichia mikurensis]UTO56295.1 hypothetical protein LUA81_04280 [Neoehrlichia mikurensis]
MFVLPNDAPIIMLWMVKDPTLLEKNQLPIPDNYNYPYKQRLLNWARSESQRKIKLYYVSTGLTEGNIKALHTLTDVRKGGRNNIEVIDLNAKFSHKYDLQYLSNKNVPFAWKIDILRLMILLEDAPSLYCDFDILPINKKITVKIGPLGYSMIAITQFYLENSVIGVINTNNVVARLIHDIAIQHYILNTDMLSKVKYDVDFIHHISQLLMILILHEVNEKTIMNANFNIEVLQDKLDAFLQKNKLINKYMLVHALQSQLGINNYFEYFGICKSKSNLVITSDCSWYSEHQNMLYEHKSAKNKTYSHNNPVIQNPQPQNVISYYEITIKR